MSENFFQKEFQYGRSTIEYQLFYEDRKNLAITVRPDKSVIVKAPSNSKIEKIQDKLNKRGQWILKQINYFDKFHPLQPERQYVSGETHFYLGRQYRLRIRKDTADSVKLQGKFFVVRTKKTQDQEHIKKLMKEWYADHAKLYLDRRIEIYAEKILGPDFGEIQVKYKFLKSRWGFWNSDDLLTFNIELIKTPIDCLDYVIAHEICHILYPNHDKTFYRQLSNVVNDWVERKERLEIFGVRS